MLVNQSPSSPPTYAGAVLFIQAVALLTVAGVALGCVVTHPLATDVGADLALVHLWAEDTDTQSQQSEGTVLQHSNVSCTEEKDRRRSCLRQEAELRPD